MTGALVAAGDAGSGARANGGADAATGVAGIVETVMPGVGAFAVDGDAALDGDGAGDGAGARAAGIGRGGAELDGSAFGLAAGAIRGAFAGADW